MHKTKLQNNFKFCHSPYDIASQPRKCESSAIPFWESKVPQLYAIFNLPKPTGYVMHQQFNIQQLSLPTLYLCVGIYL
jgi:hypothetical protein